MVTTVGLAGRQLKSFFMRRPSHLRAGLPVVCGSLLGASTAGLSSLVVGLHGCLCRVRRRSYIRRACPDIPGAAGHRAGEERAFNVLCSQAEEKAVDEVEIQPNINHLIRQQTLQLRDSGVEVVSGESNPLELKRRQLGDLSGRACSSARRATWGGVSQQSARQASTPVRPRKSLRPSCKFFLSTGGGRRCAGCPERVT